MVKKELGVVAGTLVRGFIAAGYELVAGGSGLYCVKPGRAVVQFVKCGLTSDGGLVCNCDSLVVMQGCKKLLEYK